MKFKVLICLLSLSLSASLQAFTVKNQLATKSVTLTNFVYYFGSTAMPVSRTVTVNPGGQWASDQQPNTTGSCTATAGQRTFDLSGLLPADVVIFYADSTGKIQYKLQ